MVTGWGEGAPAAQAHPWHDYGGGGSGSGGAGYSTCAPWDDPICRYGAGGDASAGYDARPYAGHVPFPPHGAAEPLRHSPHEWTAPAGGSAPSPCDISEPQRTEQPTGLAGFFVGSHRLSLDMSLDYTFEPAGPGHMHASAEYKACLLAHYEVLGMEMRPWAEDLHDPSHPAGMPLGMKGDDPRSYGIDAGHDGHPPPWWWHPPAGAQEAGVTFPTQPKADAQYPKLLPATAWRSPETITDENILERQPNVNGSGANTVPTVVNVTSLVPDGLYGHGKRIEIGVAFTEAVNVSTASGTPYLALDFAGERRAAPYVNGSGSDTVVFEYVVRYSDRHAGLNYTGASALSDGGGAITGASGLHADLELPAPGERGSLSFNSRLALGVAPPRIVQPVVSFGAAGSAPGNFSYPLDVAVSPLDGSIVVSDSGNGRIQVFHSNGTLASVFGSHEWHGGYSGHLRGVAVALDGRIAAADYWNYRIHVFHPNGTLDFGFATHNGDGVRFHPSDVAVDPRGWFVVASSSSSTSTPTGYAHTPSSVFRPDGTYSHSVYGGTFSVAASATAKMAYAARHGFDVEYANGTKITSLRDRGTHDGEVYGSAYTAFDNADRLVVADTGNHRIQVFHPDGTFAFKFGAEGSDPGEFIGPRGVAVSPLDGRIAVVDYWNNRIQVFAPGDYDGEYDGRPPAAAAVTSPSPRGVYGVGDRIDLNVHFTKPVLLSGQPPALALDTGAPSPRNATYVGGNGTAVLAFEYSVEPGDSTDGLSHSGTDALALASPASAISGAGGADATLSLPAPGRPGSLSYLERIAVQALQGTTPTVVNVTSLVPDGLYGHGKRIEIGVAFTEAVNVSTASGTPYLALDFAGERRAAPYVNGSGSDTVVFEYVVRYSDRHAGLNYTGASALSDGGGAITGASGLHADLELPAPGERGSLSFNSRLALGVAPPRIVQPVVSFGAAGSAPGNFSYPLDVAVSPLDGSIVVSDSGNGRIQVFHSNGTLASVFGSHEWHGGYSGHLRGVAVALDGRIAAADYWNYRIHVFHPNGTLDFGFATHNGDGVRFHPSDVAVDPRGWFVVASSSSSTSTPTGYAHTPSSVFRPDGTYSHSVYGGTFSVAASATAKMAYAARHGFDVEYANGTKITSLRDRGTHDGEVYGSAYTAFDNADRLVVADTGNHRIQVFHPDGTFAFKFGAEGSDPGEFIGPRGVAVSPLDGRIAVVDYWNNRIQVFAPGDYDGEYDGRPPAAAAVTSPSPRGVYGVGDRIDLNVHFTKPVLLSGQPPALALDTGAPSPRNATYVGGNGTAVLRFSYTVQPHDRTGGLEYAGTDALVFPGTLSETNRQGSSTGNLTLPAPGTPGSLAYSADIRLDGILAAVVSVSPSASTYGGAPVTLGHGDRMDIDVVFNRPVSVSATGGTPHLLLRVGDVERTALYAPSGQEGAAGEALKRALTFRYEVGTGEFADALECASRNAHIQNGRVHVTKEL